MSLRFGEIHGVDISEEMIRLARERLRDTPNAHAQVNNGADLGAFRGRVVRFRLLLRRLPAHPQP